MEWSFSFAGKASAVKQQLEAAKGGPAYTRARSIALAFVGELDPAADVVISAADNDEPGSDFNMRLSAVNHPAQPAKAA